MAYRLLLVEDEIGIRVALRDRLRASGYEVATAGDGKEAFARASQGGIDLIVLDLLLPGKDGLEVCHDLRRMGIDTPVLMLTAKTQLEDKLEGFSMGADDYLTKPFDVPELLARAKALLRRSTAWNQARATHVYEFGNLRLDTRQTTVWLSGKRLALSMKEYDLLHYFVTHPRETLSRDKLLKEVWKYQDRPPTRTVDVHVGWLRRKIEDDARNPRWIRTIYGVGYQFMAR
jgi:two-component system alkaline phosphatase synthesis response regulator PhoP